MHPRDTLEAFDRFLASHGIRADLVIIGGAALALLGVIDRPTRDCDVLEPLVDVVLADHARRFAAVRSAAGHPLAVDWLNHGPSSLVQVLPVGWRDRIDVLFTGQALTLRTLGHRDLLATKLWALCDRGTDLADCRAMGPTADDLIALRPWLADQDMYPHWQAHVDAVLADLARRCGHGL